uniref:fructose-bisphosphate aldolase n=1 Tax=Heterorhabditis bacteriophora TaxID=37862 RepID=A0A1I7X7D4_HETBA
MRAHHSHCFSAFLTSHSLTNQSNGSNYPQAVCKAAMAEVGGSYKDFLTQVNELRSIAQKIVADGKGILAADESTGTIGKRLSAISLENNESNRQKYRQLLFTTPNLGQHISGVILYEETYHQSTDSGERFVDLLVKQGIVPGIKLDLGVVPLAGTLGEGTTQGLDKLAERAAGFKRGGCGFAKWRCTDCHLRKKIDYGTVVYEIHNNHFFYMI